MTLYKERERFQTLSIRIGIAFSRIGLSPNQWTLISILPAMGVLYCLYISQFVAAAALLMIASFMDMIDGAVARVRGTASALGAYLDTIMDRYVEFIIVLGLMFAGMPDALLPSTAWIMIYLFGAMMTTYAKSAAMEKKIFRTELRGGILERAERMIILFIGILLAPLSRMYLTYTVVLLAVLANVSAVQRIFKAAGYAKE